MSVIFMGYLIDLFLLCQWLQTEPSLGVPHYHSPGTSVWRPMPRACAWCPCCGQLWAGHRPQQVPLWRRRLASPAAWVQGQCLVLVQVTGCHRSMTALVSQCVNTKKHSMQTCSEVITEHPTPWVLSLQYAIVCYSMLDCLCQQQKGVQAPSSRYRWIELLQKMGVLQYTLYSGFIYPGESFFKWRPNQWVPK